MIPSELTLCSGIETSKKGGTNKSGIAIKPVLQDGSLNQDIRKAHIEGRIEEENATNERNKSDGVQGWSFS